MHEQTIAKKIIDEASSYGKIVSVTIECGDLAHLPADEMREVLEKLTDWNINVTRRKAKISCKCGYVGEPKITQQLHDNNVYECPKCKHSLPPAFEGTEIILKDVEVEDDDNEDEYEDERLEEE
jgi:Zn finger protein HypA/HybF involved in hydrogenase expression